MHATLAATVMLTALACPNLSAAVEQPPPRDVLTIAAQATVEVPYDLITITLATTRDGPDAGAVQSQLRQALDAALGDARRAAKPGQIDVRTGAFSLGPRYSNKGVVSGWVGSAELVLEGRDLAGIAQLAGRLGTLSVARVAYALARETRDKAEADAAAQAIARFKARASDYAKQFGYGGYAIREVNVGTESPLQPLMRTRAMSASATSDESIPIEAGRASVNVNVGGSVVMTR